MDDTIFATLHRTAEQFVSTARMVNDSSQKRKKHSEDAIRFLKQSQEIGDILNHEIDIISRTNKKIRDQDNVVLNSCNILRTNMDRQLKIIALQEQASTIDPEILSELTRKIDEIGVSLNRALPLISAIIQKDNDIILLDNLILQRKQFQKNALHQLMKLTLKTLEDAENAIGGSLSNLNRGLKILNRLGRIGEIVRTRDTNELNVLITEAGTGWTIARNVNRSSATQLEFAEKVNLFTRQLHEDSIAIKDLVVAKHNEFAANLESITELTVILSLELNTYVEMRELVRRIQHDPDIPADSREHIANLISYVNIACRDIENLANLNYDMTDSINLNADMEKKSVDLTTMEMEYFDEIRQQVTLMTDATKYPIEGSQNNIDNGKLLEECLQKIAAEIA